jgi:hypothetical protein
MDTDHINHNKLDNRKENLRICTEAENVHNTRISRNNTSGYKGVTFHKRDKKWQTQIRSGQGKRYLGYFNTAEEAAKNYDEKAKEAFGEFARTNF